MSWREEERKRKMPFIVATYVYASSQGQRTHSARTKIDNYIVTNENALLQCTWPFLENCVDLFLTAFIMANMFLLLNPNLTKIFLTVKTEERETLVTTCFDHWINGMEICSSFASYKFILLLVFFCVYFYTQICMLQST